MTDPQIALFMLGLFIFVVLLGFPIAFTLVAMGLGFGYYAYYDPMRMQNLFDNRIFDLFVQNTFSVMSNDVLVAVPLILLMGYAVERANIVNRRVLQLPIGDAQSARFSGCCGAADVRRVRDRDRHRRRRGDVDGHVGVPG